MLFESSFNTQIITKSGKQKFEKVTSLSVENRTSAPITINDITFNPYEVRRLITADSTWCDVELDIKIESPYAGAPVGNTDSIGGVVIIYKRLICK